MNYNGSKYFVFVICASFGGFLTAADAAEQAEKAVLMERILASQRHAQDAERVQKERERALREQTEKQAAEFKHVEAQQIANHRKRLEESRIRTERMLALNELIDHMLGANARRLAGAEGRSQS